MVSGLRVSEWMKGRRIIAVTGAVVALFLSLLYAQPLEEVCKFTYTGQPEELHETEITVNEKMVAMAEYIYVGTPTGAVTVPATPSVFFIIDHSSSMYTNANKDQDGNRFRVTRDLIDSLRTRFPKAEVGISVFTEYLYFRPEASNDFVQCPGIDSGAYLPFYRMDSSYVNSGGKPGWQILQGWMETDTTIGTNEDPNLEFVDLVYRPNPMWPDWYAGQGSNTNINAGFEAAKHAFQSATYDKRSHFIIFLSDGARSPQSLPDDYVQGVNTPTTFTIYFIAPGEQLPPEITTMNTNIQNNGYSSSNPSSELWGFENTSYEALMQFLMDNVINVISNIQTSYPTQINVYGSITNPNPWDTSGFDFTKLFPLTGVTTPFEYDIDYKIWTLDPDSNPVWKDTSTHTEFDVIIQTGAPDLPDTFDVKCWERELGYYYNNSQVSMINETMAPIELRFGFVPGDANYSYTKADVQVVSTAGVAQDNETFTLTKSGNTFSATFNRVFLSSSQSPTPGNGIIEHYVPDTLVATFRNNEDPKLPLDTIQATVICILSGSINIVAGYYFDNNADGYVDSIFVDVSTDIAGGLTDAHVAEILEKAVTLPSFRDFTVNGSGVVSGGFYIDVTEGNADPTTYVTNDDKLEVESVILSMGGWVVATTAPIYDRVAPIIHWEDKSAYLIDFQVDSIADTLTVKFSEQVTDVTHSEPFLFLSMVENTQYQVQLNHVSHNANEMKFTVVDFNPVQYIRDGDSIWIQRTDRVGDNVSPINYQNNNNNIRRKLWVERRLIPYVLIPNTTSPINISNPNSNTIIPTDVIDIINSIDPNWLNNNNIQTNNNGEYIGMIITIKPNKDPNIMLPDFKLEGFISIFDAVGNQLVSKEKMLWWEEQKALIWIWTGKNMNDRNVGAGSYLAIAEIEEKTVSLGYQYGGPKEAKRIYIGIME